MTEKPLLSPLSSLKEMETTGEGIGTTIAEAGIKSSIRYVNSLLFKRLIYVRAVLHSYRNQSIDFLCKSIDWFSIWV